MGRHAGTDAFLPTWPRLWPGRSPCRRCPVPGTEAARTTRSRRPAHPARSAPRLRHPGVAHHLLEERKVVLAPRLDAHGALAPHATGLVTYLRERIMLDTESGMTASAQHRPGSAAAWRGSSCLALMPPSTYRLAPRGNMPMTHRSPRSREPGVAGQFD